MSDRSRKKHAGGGPHPFVRPTSGAARRDAETCRVDDGQLDGPRRRLQLVSLVPGAGRGTGQEGKSSVHALMSARWWRRRGKNPSGFPREDERHTVASI